MSRSYVPTEVKNTTTGLVIHSKERVYMVDSGASLHMMGLSSLNTERRVQFDSQAKIWIRPPMALWSETRNHRSTARSLALINGSIW